MPSHASTVPNVSTPVQPEHDGSGTGPAGHPAPHTGVTPTAAPDAPPGAAHSVKPVAYEAHSHDTAIAPVGPYPGAPVDTLHPGHGMSHDVVAAGRISVADTTSDPSSLHAGDGVALSGGLFPDQLSLDQGHVGFAHPALHPITDPHIVL